MSKWPAISRLVRPCATSLRISFCRGVSACVEFPRPVKLAFSVLEAPLVLVLVRVLGMVYSLTNQLPPVNTLVVPSIIENPYGLAR